MVRCTSYLDTYKPSFSLCISQALYYLCSKVNIYGSFTQKLICFLLILGGIALSGGALYGFWSLYHAYSTHERVVGVIQKTSTERVHRHRKVRFEHEMLIKYSTDKYGDCYVSKKYYWPFRQVGDEVTVLCRPQYTNDVRLPGDECWIWGIMLACGLVCAGGAWVMLRPQKPGEELNCN